MLMCLPLDVRLGETMARFEFSQAKRIRITAVL